MNLCAILLAFLEPMFMQVAMMRTNQSSNRGLPSSSSIGEPSSFSIGNGTTTTKAHVRSSSGLISNWKNMCRPSSLKPALYVLLTSAM